MIKLYKFRPLGNEIDYCRARDVLETGKFWCSKFSKLNDPMEGVFRATDESLVKKIYDAKNKFRICSFSNSKAFINPAMWGYYAKGFKGLAVEIEVNTDSSSGIFQVNYSNNISKVTSKGKYYIQDIKEILTTKLKPWEHEGEYRFLKEHESANLYSVYSIGEISGVYFGNPYGDLVNSDSIIAHNQNLIKYNDLKTKLIAFARLKHIKTGQVEIKNGKVLVC